MPAENRAHDLFLLLLSLSQLREEETIVSVFCQAMSGMWEQLTFSRIPAGADPHQAAAPVFELAASGQSYGSIIFGGALDELSEMDSALVRNAVRMLAVILEKRDQERQLEAHHGHLREEVAQRTLELEQSEARYRFLFENMRQGVVYQDRQGRIHDANPAAERILGLSRDQMLGRTSLDPRWRAVREDGSDLPGEEHPAMVALRTGRPVADMTFGVCNPSGGGLRWLSVSAVPEFRDGEETPYRAFATFSDITARVQAEKALKASEASFRALFGHMTEGVALHEIIRDDAGIARDYRILDVNPAFERQSGFAVADVVGRLASEAYGSPPPLLDCYERVTGTGVPEAFDFYYPPVDRHFHISVFTPQPGRFATVFMDVTQERRNRERLEESLREKNTLLKEVHHRVKNNLQIISSLLNLQIFSDDTPDPKAPLRESAQRVAAMALVHEHIYKSDSLARIDIRAYTAKLASNLVLGMQGDKRIVHAVDLPELHITADKAVPLGLALNEILTNALKHAFADRDDGEIRITGDVQDDRLRIIVRDNGPGFPPGFDLDAPKTLGMQLVANLVRQLEGRLDARSSDGAVLSMDFPV